MALSILNANRTPPIDRSSCKVKFLCSFDGKLMPCQSDGALSYVGGLTRIIAVRHDATFNELYSKMEDAYGGPVFKALDTLVISISYAKDMEIMMEEYERHSQASRDGSAKLWVFLSSPSDMESDTESSDSEPAYQTRDEVM